MEDQIKNELKDIFANVNSWLNFAELKNGAIIATNVAIIFGIFSELSNELEKVYLNIMVSCFILSILVASLSFVPILQNWFIDSKVAQRIYNKYSKIDNLQYYGYISSLSKEKYLKEIYLKYCDEVIDTKNKKYGICLDLSDEIVVNSKIAIIKYYYFKVATMPLFIGLIMMLLIFLCG